MSIHNKAVGYSTYVFNEVSVGLNTSEFDLTA